MTLADLVPPDGAELGVHASGRDVSATELRARVAAVADALVAAGIGPGAPVGILLPNGADAVATLFAVWRSGGVCVPLNPRLTDPELAALVAAVTPSAFVTVPEHQDRVKGQPVVVLDAGEVTTGPGAAGPSRYDAGVALVSFTSGTTGPPKPVPLTHDRVLALLDKVIGTLRTGDRSGRPAMPNLIPVPLSTWAGIYQVLFAFRVGAPVVVMDRFDTTVFADLVRRFGIRSTVLPPAAMVMLTDDTRIEDLAPLRYVRSISSPLSPLQARRFRDRFGISVLNGYGQTELGGEVAGWSAADSKAFGESKLGSVGRPHPGVEVRVEEAGELSVRTPGVVQEADLEDRLSADGWFRTGDVARIDDDGFVWIEGRVSDMINRGGLKVYPAEVEEVLRLSPAIADAAVVGVPDERLGEVPVAFCVPADIAADLPSHDAMDLLCREHLAPYKVPLRYEPVTELPRNEAGKVLKRELMGLRASEQAQSRTDG